MADVWPVNPYAAFLQNAPISLSPFPGFHPGLVCMAPLEPKTLLIETPHSTRPLNHTFPHSLPSPFVKIRAHSWLRSPYSIPKILPPKPQKNRPRHPIFPSKPIPEGYQRLAGG